ncbi:MAG: DUF2232 domain-containing protein [bacterium]|nr:DUF2232 domain-containing protein [bacterium]
MEPDAQPQAELEHRESVKPPPRRLSAGVAGVASLALAASLVVLPGFGLLVAPLALIPVLQQVPAGRTTAMAWSWVVAGLIVVILAGGGATWAVILGAYLFVVVIPAVSVEAWSRYGWSQGRWIALNSAFMAALSLLVVALMALPEDPLTYTAAVMQGPFDEIAEMSGSAGVPKAELYREIDRLEASLKWIMPSVPIGYLVLILFWVRPRLAILGLKVPAVAFEEYSSDEMLPWAFVATGVGTLLLDGTPRWIAINLLMTVMILYFAHGLAIIRAHLARWVGRGWFVRWGLGLLCLRMPIPVVVAALGIVDSFYRLRPRKDTGGGNS